MPIELSIPCFDPFLIARSGQCFRMRQDQEDRVTAIARSERVRIARIADGMFRFDCSQETFEKRWKAYFDIDRDYGQIEAEAMQADPVLCHAAAHCGGMRILQQDPWETLISFLISQRKSIKAIQSCVEQLCQRFGDSIDAAGGEAFYAFPTPQQLFEAGEAGLRACGVGYRAPYLMDAAQRVMTGNIPLDDMADCSNEELLAELTRIYGVGVKVASCVMLFGFHRLDSSPVDVWIQRVIDESFGGVSPFGGYGKHAGIYQQYMFLARKESGQSLHL